MFKFNAKNNKRIGCFVVAVLVLYCVFQVMKKSEGFEGGKQNCRQMGSYKVCDIGKNYLVVNKSKIPGEGRISAIDADNRDTCQRHCNKKVDGCVGFVWHRDDKKCVFKGKDNLAPLKPSDTSATFIRLDRL
jgi:hypothetical protein